MFPSPAAAAAERQLPRVAARRAPQQTLRTAPRVTFTSNTAVPRRTGTRATLTAG